MAPVLIYFLPLSLGPNHLFNLTRYSTNGSSRERIKRLLRKESCECPRLTCFKKLLKSENDLLTFVDNLWQLEKPKQDAYALASAFTAAFLTLGSFEPESKSAEV